MRNYDYSPDLFERVVYSSSFTGRRVIGMGDCLWGLLDGMNEDGLVASLAFGGRRGSASGFGIPLVVRYVLEVADSVSSAVAALERVPVSMTYNITLVDARGDAATAFVSLAAHRWLRRRARDESPGQYTRIRRTRRGSTASSGSGSSATCSSGGPLPTRSSRRSCARRSTAPTTRAPSAPSTRRCIARPKVPSITCGRPRPGIARSTILTRPSPYDWGSRDDTGWARRDVDTELASMLRDGVEALARRSDAQAFAELVDLTRSSVRRSASRHGRLRVRRPGPRWATLRARRDRPPGNAGAADASGGRCAL